jgi:hypothetical protein
MQVYGGFFNHPLFSPEVKHEGEKKGVKEIGVLFL